MAPGTAGKPIHVDLTTYLFIALLNPDISCMNFKGRQLKEVDIFICSSVATSNGKIQNEINERIKKASQSFYYLVIGLLRNKDIYKKCKLNIFDIYFKRILLCEAETWTTTKERIAKFKPWK